MAIMLVAMTTVSNAQKTGEMAVGGNLVLGLRDVLHMGIGAELQYNVIAPIRLDGSFTYSLEMHSTDVAFMMWDLSVNGHWLFPMSEQIILYPLAGLDILNTSVDLDLGYGWGV